MEPIDNISPAEAEANYYSMLDTPAIPACFNRIDLRETRRRFTYRFWMAAFCSRPLRAHCVGSGDKPQKIRSDEPSAGVKMGRNDVKTKFDWKAAALAGVIAGLIFLMLEMGLVAVLQGQSLWGPPRMISAIIMGTCDGAWGDQHIRTHDVWRCARLGLPSVGEAAWFVR